MALALYRRYRPDTFEGVIGQEQVTVPLMRALDEGKLTHAYLFSGPRGCGKTSSARILARCVNCAKGPTSHPCGECESCKDLATGGPGSIDVVEIDAASHNGVDDARELRERAGFAPARDRYKIFILDEAHMVTPQGFNALLKIVEEPPEHVMFIFATTEPDKVIGTIRSRTHHYPFRLVPQEIMGPYLEQICDKEGIKPEPGVLKLAMRAGGGSMRDTLSVLDQLMIGSVDGVITHDASVALLGFTPETLIGQAIDAVIDGNGEALYGVVQKVVVGGFDPRRFVEDLLARVRDLMVLTLAGDRAESVLSDSAEGEDLDELHRQAKALGLSALTVMADTINSTLSTMTGAISPRMRLELLAARLLAEHESGWSIMQQTAAVPVAPGGNAAAHDTKQAVTPGAHTGFAGASRHAGAPAQGGFAGAARNQEHDRGNAGVTVSPAPSATVPVQAADASESAPAVVSAPANLQADGWAMGTQPDATVPNNRTPDETWDALVRDLPEDVRRYVSRSKVLRIKYEAQSKSGNPRLWLKFDKALSKYAFALAVAKEEIDGTTKVVDIVRAEVRKAFGERVEIAPTRLTDDGVRAPAFKQLPASEQQRIKAQVLQENMRSTAAGASQWAENSNDTDREQSDASNEQPGASDDGDSHRSLNGFAPERPVSQASEQNGNGSSQAAEAQSVVGDDDDPWATPAVPAVPANPDRQGEGQSGEHQSEHESKHVAVPDVSDGIDPWAVPAASAQSASAQSASSASEQSATVTAPSATGESVTGDASRHNAQGRDYAAQEPHWGASAGEHVQQQENAGTSQLAATDPWQASGEPIPPGPELAIDPAVEPDPWAMSAAAAAPPQPQVAADEDEYSMSDESLGEATAMSMDDIKRLFEVKKVEEFTADDPHNPRNMHQTTKHTEE
ncbi:DNA polymerase III subunit gamma/tau [Bifidobacterium angulatum]|uniref:DNA polymerase III subunit gamma/tau n=1 Tax=Bifidobacterium angulatum TaxID=1683 RepID=UPI003AACCE24